MESGAILISPNVEIIKDKNGNLLDETVVVSVMTCAAPRITRGLEGMSNAEYWPVEVLEKATYDYN